MGRRRRRSRVWIWSGENTANFRRQSPGEPASVAIRYPKHTLKPFSHSRVLDEVLSGKATEDAVSEIHEYLTGVGNDLREGKIDIDDLIVYKVSRASSASAE